MRYTPQTVAKLPESSGVYLFYDKDTSLLYIGKARNLKKRVSSYFRILQKGEVKKERLVSQIAMIEVILVGSEFEALLLEADLIKKRQPKYNTIGKDDKHYIYIKITNEEFPRVLFARNDKEKKAVYFGPFPSIRIVRDMLRFIRPLFPYCTQKRNAKRVCFYTHLGLCTPCPTEIKKEKGEIYQQKKKKYRENIRHIKMLLKGHIQGISRILRMRMEKHVEREEYEEAQIYKEKSDCLEILKNHTFISDIYIENPHFFERTAHEAQKKLSDMLKAYFSSLGQLHRIECYDISTISGKCAVGSCVLFVNGLPEKNGYRRFKIKTGTTPNDFAMLSEIFERRLNHTEWQFPDLFIVDGGKPQLLAIQKVFLRLKITIPLIGIAKRFEELVIPRGDTFIKLQLGKRSPVLHLVQRIRDEAHRFAHTYHRVIRLRSLLEKFKQ